MTEEEIKAKKESFKQNELYKESSSPYKDYQFEQFTANGEVLSGQHSRPDMIDGSQVLVLFNFNKGGLIHSENDMPAIEYPNHWEYWSDGLIQKVVDAGGDTEEYWENGVPVRIERNLSKKEG
ncbi:MAG: hypothetical protein IJ530_01015 [Treponema sp.]|uniref:hypothetical protein n=1 Tax=Treponema sp. TaxID=166 RepID=UPI0025DAE2BA|nr:hypothetical protein [Treponema sp.]MBQ8678325.1 hypothetical protein [Treponema sp.]